MKEFYVLNLDMRRIAIVAGGALTALGLTLFIGMAIGRGQGERNARMAAEEREQQKLGLAPEAAKPAEHAEKVVIAQGPAASEKPAAAPIIAAPESKSEIPLREDPLVSGPPKKKHSEKKSHKVAKHVADEEVAEKPVRKKKALAKAKPKEEPEVSGKVEHSKVAAAAGRYTIQVAAFKRSSEANGLIEKLKGEGIKARSEHAGDYYLVTVGRTKSKEKLAKALSRLKELEYDAYIRKIKNPSEDT